jgi:hypothetical protein
VQPGDTVGGRWRIVREAGHGGMGTVYRAADVDDGAAVAIKVLRRTEALDDALASGRFAREVEVLASLDDPRIVRYVAHGTADNGRPFLVEEWVEGESLGQVLDGDGLTPGEAARVIAAVAAGLAAAHAGGIVHRDIKPDNLLFVGGDLAQVKIIDFGIARRGDEAFPITRTGSFVGTPGYVSPEQARGNQVLDGRSDVFSLGCILYECLTGRPPFAGRTVTAVRAKVLMIDPPPIALFCDDVPDALTALVGKMLAKSPDDRVAGALEVAAAIAPFTSLAGARRPGHSTGETAAIGPRIGGTDVDTVATIDTREAGLLACIVIAEASGPVGAARLRAAIAPFGGRLETLAGSTVLVTAPPTLLPSEQVVVAARCALAIRPMVAGPIVLSGVADAPRADTLSMAIDDGVGTLSRAAARTEPFDDAVIVDRCFAAPLREAGFAIEQAADGATLLHRLG